jgi:hypothetical protein
MTSHSRESLCADTDRNWLADHPLFSFLSSPASFEHLDHVPASHRRISPSLQCTEMSSRIDPSCLGYLLLVSCARSYQLQSNEHKRHVFCIACAEQWQANVPDLGSRCCPICKTHLPGDSDYAWNYINPPEDFKAIHLAGMPPTIIMDCAEKALGFYNYQVTQEMYVHHLCLLQINLTKGTGTFRH